MGLGSVLLCDCVQIWWMVCTEQNTLLGDDVRTRKKVPDEGVVMASRFLSMLHNHEQLNPPLWKAGRCTGRMCRGWMVCAVALTVVEVFAATHADVVVLILVHFHASVLPCLHPGQGLAATSEQGQDLRGHYRS